MADIRVINKTAVRNMAMEKRVNFEQVMTKLEMIKSTAEIIKYLVTGAEVGSDDPKAMALDAITGHAAKRIIEGIDKVVEELQTAASV